MSDGKGKGRAKGDENGDKGLSDEQPSMPSRVATSATGLLRSALANPTSSELNERAASALADSGKGQFGQSSGSSSSSVWADRSKAPQPSVGQADLTGTFRGGHNGEHVRQSENQFSSFLDGIDSFTSSGNTGGHVASRGLGDDLDKAWSRSQPFSSLPLHEQLHKSISEQQSRDGEDVLALLSQDYSADETFEAPQEDENYDWAISREQLSQLRAMTKDLFPPIEAHGTVDPRNPLNLAPNFEGVYGHAPAGSDEWREQWDVVLNRYTDEVWGGLLPLVKEARREVDDLRNDPSRSEQPKALRRLGAILGHLRKY